jgi:hypothetical protein
MDTRKMTPHNTRKLTEKIKLKGLLFTLTNKNIKVWLCICSCSSGVVDFSNINIIVINY